MKIRTLCFVLFWLLLSGFSFPLYAQVSHEGFDGWLELDGVDDYASISDNSTLDIGNGATDDFTIECFFYFPDTNITGTKTLIFKNTSYGLYLILSNTAQDRIIFRINFSPVGTDYFSALSFVYLSAGWHHIAASYDNEYTSSFDAMQIFLDGTKIFDASNFEITPGVYNSTGIFYVGAGNGLNPFYEKIDEVRISDIIRYSGASYTVPSSPFSMDADTRALWHFDESAGSTSFFDESTNNNTLASVNGAQSLPVELIEFTAKNYTRGVELHWTTATETNNYGFEIERRTEIAENGWMKIGFVSGAGTSHSPTKYSFVDNIPFSNTYVYRLKQIDREGTIKYSPAIKIHITPTVFSLAQNFPNPFNPKTIISYQIPVNSYVTLKIFNVIGDEVATLVNEQKDAGTYSVQFDAPQFSSGIYFYKLFTENFTTAKKMILMK